MNAQERKNRIETLKVELEDLKRVHHEEGRRLHPKAEYSYSVKMVTADDTFCAIAKITECLRVVGLLENEEEVKKHLATYGTSNVWDRVKNSVIYYRINGILLHDGGGWLLLQDKVACNDEQWESLKQGNIPEELVYKSAF